MLKKILIALAAMIVAFLMAVALQPSEFQVEGTATMSAPPATVFDQVNDFHNWDGWSPWAKLDPNASRAQYHRHGARHLKPADRILILFVPIVGAIWLLIELGFLAGTPGPNRYGPCVTDPVDATLGGR